MKLCKLLACLLLALFLTGCWGYKETDEIAYVVVMGFDKGPDKALEMTFQIANPQAIAGQAGGGGGSGGANQPLITISTMAKLPIGAFNLVNTEISRQLSLLHTTAYVFSDELAREGLNDFIIPLNRYRETRGTGFIYVARGSAKEFIEKNKPLLEINPTKQYELVSQVNQQHGLTPVVQFRQFLQRTKGSSREPVATLVGVYKKDLESHKSPEFNKLGDFLAGDMPADKGQTQFIGTAVFKGDKMVGELTGDETRYLNFLTGELKQSFIIIEDPIKEGNPVGVTLRQARKPMYKINTTEDHPMIVVDIFVEPEIVGIASGVNYEAPSIKPVLEKAIADVIKKGCLDLVNRTQEEFDSDIAGIGRYARKNFLTYEALEKYDWSKAYPLATVDINVHARIRRTGLMIKTGPIHY